MLEYNDFLLLKPPVLEQGVPALCLAFKGPLRGHCNLLIPFKLL